MLKLAWLIVRLGWEIVKVVVLLVIGAWQDPVAEANSGRLERVDMYV